jgi:hypothetical protein
MKIRRYESWENYLNLIKAKHSLQKFSATYSIKELDCRMARGKPKQFIFTLLDVSHGLYINESTVNISYTFPYREL